MKPIPFDPDRFESDPFERSFICPVGDYQMQIPYRIPEIQRRYLDAKTKRERGRIMAEFALKLGLGSDNPELWKMIKTDWIEEKREAG
tara:strand:- start:708 stop:971 length:264 start_codon:yes stop_codon:yes gene_type:complete